MKTSKKIIKIFGLKRSGTNYLEWILKNNFKDLLVFTNQFQEKGGVPQELSNILGDNIGNKHESPTQLMSKICTGAPLTKHEKDRLFSHAYFNKENRLEAESIISARNVYYIFNTKNPFSWYESFCKFFGHNMHPIQKKYLIKYSSIYESYYDFLDKHEDRCLIVRYEDLLSKTENSLSLISKKLNINTTASVRRPPSRIGPDLCKTGKPFDKKSYFLNEEFMEKYSQEEIKLIGSLLTDRSRNLYRSSII